MKLHYLEFEKPLQKLALQVEELEKDYQDNPKLNISKEIKQLQSKTDDLLHEIYDNLSPWQISQISRHPQRPYTQDYID
jgi:acetyl-CoA carboxylase carboxyl transferase subunit alpha